MQKSENKIRQICWGWDGVYDYHDMRQFYKRLIEDEVEDQLHDDDREKDGSRSYLFYSHPYIKRDATE